jgi:lipooligosaccharide transport system permease protein
MNAKWLFRWPHVGRRTWKVWRRDSKTFMKTYKTNFIPPLLEPILYLVAFGFGLGGLVVLPGMDISYVQFIAPALVAISIMTAAFFECTFGSFVRMYFQKTFDAIIATPVDVDEVIMGELLWGASKSTIYTVIVLGVITAFGLATYPLALLVIPFSFLAGLLFAGLGMMFTAVSPNIDTLSYPTSLYITPMMLISGTFFPLDRMPLGIQQFAWVFIPLVHVTNIIREMTLGHLSMDSVLSLVWILVGTALVVVLSINMMRRRLIV